MHSLFAVKIAESSGAMPVPADAVNADDARDVWSGFT